MTADTKQTQAGCDGRRGTTYMSRQVFPQAPSPTMTSFLRISAMAMGQEVCVESELEMAEGEKHKADGWGRWAVDGG